VSQQDDYRAVGEHYARGDLAAVILAALHEAGKDPDSITVQDLVPVDQLHTRGKDATLELARLAGMTPEMRVLDVGGGLGGPARTLASEIGCSVEVLDVTEEFCRAGEMLTTRTGLGDLVSFRHASALDIPHPDASFDAVWMQHSSMNIADKERLYAEIHRVLRSGGHLALHEIMAGPVAPILFPVPWARTPEISFLRPPEEVRTLIITGIGFDESAWVNETASALRWFRKRLAAADAASEELPPLGLHLVLGADVGQMFSNLARNLQEDRVVVVQGVFERL
jgi:ubiquinone/menaquinone biosynthesis C-methylase UbiE